MEPLLIQHHIAKTAGTSLRQVTRANFAANEVADIERTFHLTRIPPDFHWETVIRRARAAYQSLPADRRTGTRCFMGHAAPLLMAVIDDRPVRAFTMLRDPVERVVSLYRHAERQARAPASATGRWAPMAHAMRDRRLSLKDIYLSAESRSRDPGHEHLFRPFFNEQGGQILLGVLDSREMPVTSDRASLEPYTRRALDILSDRYVVGTQDHFSQSVRLFADSFGWRTLFVPRANVRGESLPVDEETSALIRAYNAVDAELHAHYEQRLAYLPGVGRVARLRGGTGHRARRRLAWARRAVARP
ncbi:MAG: hypothetical protein ACR2IN_11140 [Thermoleophilaceae bacterium]